MELIKPVKERGDCAEAFLGLHYFYEAITGRNGERLGVEITVRFSDSGSRTVRSNVYSENQSILLKNICFRAKLLIAGLSIEKKSGANAHCTKVFIRVEKSALLKQDVLLEIKQTVISLDRRLSKLVLIVDASRVEFSRLNAMLIQNILTIKEWGGELALHSSGELGPETPLLNLNVYDYIFMDMAKLRLPFQSEADEAEYQALYETMCNVVQTCEVKFIARNLKSHEHAVAAHAMPFRYFQTNRH